MSENLFEKLFENLDQFVQLCYLVPTKLKAPQKNISYPSDAEKDAWIELGHEIKERKFLLQQLVQSGVEKNKELIDQRLITLRQLPRKLSEGYCYWSGYYEDIDKALDSIYVTLVKIDRKYCLGQHSDN